MIIRICDKCKGTNIKTLIPKIKTIIPNCEIIVGCQNVCGIGRNKSFLILNDKLIIADNENELIGKLKQNILN